MAFNPLKNVRRHNCKENLEKLHKIHGGQNKNDKLIRKQMSRELSNKMNITWKTSEYRKDLLNSQMEVMPAA